MRKVMLVTIAMAWALAGAPALADDHVRTYQTRNLFMFNNAGIMKPGAVTLYRGKQGVEMRVAAGGLEMNSSYTVWWVIFNNPAACAGSCGGKDLGTAAVHASVLYAAGFVTGLGDTGNVTAQLEAGPPPAGVDVQLGNGLMRGNGYGAEIHVILRTHGITTPGFVDQQIGSFNGACTPTCANVQAAVFPPVP